MSAIKEWLASLDLYIKTDVACDDPTVESEEDFWKKCHNVYYIQTFDDPSVGMYAENLSPLFKSMEELEEWCRQPENKAKLEEEG